MPTYDQHPVDSRVKMLLVGDSGAGKTSMLAQLANAGYNLWILDYDNGLDILQEYLEPAALKRVRYKTLTDDTKNPAAFDDGLKAIANWKEDGGEELGPVAKLGPQDVLVIDSLSFMGDSALRRVMKLNGKKLTERPTQAEWGDAIRDLEGVIQYVMGAHVGCNVVMTTHVRYVEDSAGTSRAYPSALGSLLPTKIGRYFNVVCRLDAKPSSKGTQRSIRTISDYKMDLKNTAPSILAADEEADLAKVFAAIKGNAEKKLKA